MTVSHDFQLIESCDDPTAWSPTGDGAVSQNTGNYIEGTAALNVYKTGTSTTYFGAVHEFTDPIDMSDLKLMAIYIYLSENVKDIIRYVYLKIHDVNGTVATFDRTDNVAFNQWVPIYAQYTGTSIDWTQVKKIEVGFGTWSSSQTVSEGDIVVDRVLLGKGFWILYNTDQNPHRLWEIAALDAKDNLMMVKRISKYAYYVMAPIYIGNGEDVGALEIQKEAVILDATQLGQWYYGLITVYANSFLITDSSVLVHVVRPVYFYGGAGLRFLTNAIFRANNTYYVSTSSPFYGYGFRHNFSTKEFTATSLYTNVMLWLYNPTLQNLNWTGAFVLLPGASIVFDDYAARGLVLDTLFYVTSGSELVPRNVGEMSFTNIVFAGGRLRVDARAIAHVYNPVNFRPELADTQVTGVGTVYIYYDVYIYVVDRYGNPLVGVTVEIYNSQDELVFTGTTDGYGKVSARLNTYYYWSDGTNTVRIDYNPFIVVVKVGEGEIARGRILVYSRSTFYVTPDNVYIMTTWPEKTIIQVGEPFHIYARIKKIDGTPVSGLEVYADITAPDKTIYTISFQESASEPGTYIGYFDQDHQIGHYDYVAYAVIERALVEARNSFEAGIIQAGLDEIKALIRRHDAKLDAYMWLN